MVCSDAAKNRLETRLDRPYSPPYHIQKPGCKKGRIPTPRHQPTLTNQTRSVLYRPSYAAPAQKRGRPLQNTPTISTSPQGLQRRTIAKAPRPLDLGPRYRTPPRSPPNSSRKATPPNPTRNTRNPQVRRRTSNEGYHPRVMEPLRRQLLLRQKERREASPSPRLSPNQSLDSKKP